MEEAKHWMCMLHYIQLDTDTVLLWNKVEQYWRQFEILKGPSGAVTEKMQWFIQQ